MAASNPLQSLIASGTKLWLDSIDPDLVQKNRALGASGATSNPIIVSDLLRTGRFDDQMAGLMREGLDDEALAWAMTDRLVKMAQDVFLPVWEQTKADDGYVSFELDPLLEDAACKLSIPERSAKYIELGKKWAKGHKNRMIKVPATPAGLGAVEDMCAAGITLNVTLIFSERQYILARDAVWRGAQKRATREPFKSVYSIFVSRVDVYTEVNVPTLSHDAQGMVGIVNAKRIWKLNHDFWAAKKLPINQEMIFASTGTKHKEYGEQDPPYKYVAALAGSDIETNPPATNDAVAACGQTFTRQVDKLPPADVLADIDAKVDVKKMEETLMTQGLAKFADPFKKLLSVIASKRQALQK